MDFLKVFIVFLSCSSALLQTAAGVATSHQSMVSGDGWRYSYGIVHGPPGIGHAVGESFPHGYGGFGTYAPKYGYEGYSYGYHEVPHVLPELHAPVPEVQIGGHLPVLHAPLPASLAVNTESLKPINAIHPLPIHDVKPLSTPDYIMPSYLSGHQYGSGYLSTPASYGSAYVSAPASGEYASGYLSAGVSGHEYGTEYLSTPVSGHQYESGYLSAPGSGYKYLSAPVSGHQYESGHLSAPGSGYKYLSAPGSGYKYGSEYLSAPLSGQHYDSSYLGDHKYSFQPHGDFQYGDLSHYFNGEDDYPNSFRSYDYPVLSDQSPYGDYFGDNFKNSYNNYYATSYHH